LRKGRSIRHQRREKGKTEIPRHSPEIIPAFRIRPNWPGAFLEKRLRKRYLAAESAEGWGPAGGEKRHKMVMDDNRDDGG